MATHVLVERLASGRWAYSTLSGENVWAGFADSREEAWRLVMSQTIGLLRLKRLPRDWKLKGGVEMRS